MLTNCLAECAHLTITVSETQRDICEIIGILSYLLAFDAPVRGVPVGIAPPQTDRRTPGDGNSRAMHSIARQKRFNKNLENVYFINAFVTKLLANDCKIVNVG